MKLFKTTPIFASIFLLGAISMSPTQAEGHMPKWHKVGGKSKHPNVKKASQRCKNHCEKQRPKTYSRAFKINPMKMGRSYMYQLYCACDPSNTRNPKSTHISPSSKGYRAFSPKYQNMKESEMINKCEVYCVQQGGLFLHYTPQTMGMNKNWTYCYCTKDICEPYESLFCPG